MKKWIWIPVLVLAFLFFACQKKEESGAPVAQGVAQKLDSAIENLSQGQVGSGIQDLLDTILLTNPKGFISENFENTIREAKVETQKGNMEGAFALLAQSRALIQEDVAQPQVEELESKPESEIESDPAPIAEAVKKLIEQAKGNFKEGNAKEGIRSILDALSLFSPI